MDRVQENMAHLELEDQDQEEILQELTRIEQVVEEKTKIMEATKKKLVELEDLEIEQLCLQLKMKKITELEVSDERKITII